MDIELSQFRSRLGLEDGEDSDSERTYTIEESLLIFSGRDYEKAKRYLKHDALEVYRWMMVMEAITPKPPEEETPEDELFSEE